VNQPLQVLVIEDSEDDAAILAVELRRGGYAPACHRVETPEALGAALERQPWDLIIADYHLPRFDGLAALAIVKDKMIDFVHDQGLARTAVDLYAEEELERRVGRFFDELTIHMVRGYETALRNAEIISKLAQVSSFEWVEFAHRDSSGKYSNLSWYSVGPTDVVVDYEKTIDIPAERDRLTKEIAKFEKGIAAAERQLGNEAFLSKAPAHIVDGLKKQAEETRLLLEKARAALDALPPE